MPFPTLDSENDDLDLQDAAGADVLTHTPHATLPKRCQAIVMLGDGTKDLDGSGGDFELTITVGSQVWDGGPQTKTLGTEGRAMLQSVEFWVPANTAVVVNVKSPNAADSDVDVTAYLFDVTPLETGIAAGAYAVTITVDDGSDPIAGALVRVTEVGGSTSHFATTDANGEASFSLDAASWTVAITKPMYSFTPATLVVSGAATPTYSMTPIVSSPSEPGTATLAYTCVDETGAAEEGVLVEAEITAIPSGDTGVAYDATKLSDTSDANGLVELQVVHGATYNLRRGGRDWTSVTIPGSGSTITLESIIGRD